MDYAGALALLAELTKFGINLGLERITRLLGCLGNPEAELAAIHVGGTNGKGSTSAILAAVLGEAGFRVGVYTSPHLVSYTERFTINGQPIAEADFAALMAEIEPTFAAVRADTGENPTEFEVLTALGFLYFQRQRVDILILEVGLGGDIDSTNVIARPLLSIITNVSIEHTDYLGRTIPEIAARKSGLIKPGRPVITASGDARALTVIRRTAEEKGAPFYDVRTEVSWEAKGENTAGQVFAVRFKRGWPRQQEQHGQPGRQEQQRQQGDLEAREFTLALWGDHQLVNAATALLALKLLVEQGWKIDCAAIGAGLASVRWPGRLDVLGTAPLIVVDGAHNPAGMETLAVWLAQRRQVARKVILVIGMLADKDRAEAVKIIEPLADRVIVTRPASTRAGDWKLTGAYFQNSGDIIYRESVENALDEARRLAGREDIIVITGSLYLLGEVYTLLGRLPFGRF